MDLRLTQVPLWLPPSPPQGGRRSKARPRLALCIASRIEARRLLSLPLVGRVGEGRSLHEGLRSGFDDRSGSLSPLEGEMAGRPEGGAATAIFPEGRRGRAA